MHGRVAMMRAGNMTVAVAAITLAACAHAAGPPQHAKAAFSEASIRTARALGADRVPDAAPRLEAAQDNLARALRLMDQGETEQADGLLVRAEADAELASTLAREAHARTDAEEIAARARTQVGGRR